MKRSLRTGGRPAKIYLIAVLLFMYLPILVLVIYSFNSGKSGVWQGFTMDWYSKLFQNRQMMQSLRTSLELALLSCLGAAVIGTLGAVGMSRSYFKAKGAFENISTLPIMVPEIILGLAYLAFFSGVGVPFGMTAMAIAHTTFCIPYVYINVRSRLQGMDPSITEAARDLGASPMRAFWDITLPLITPAVLSGVLLAFAMSMDDVIISIFLSNASANPLPVRIFSMLKTGVTPEVNALCTLMLLVIFVAFGLFTFLQTRAKQRRNSRN